LVQVGAALYGEPSFAFSAAIGWAALVGSVEQFGADRRA
jgi:hypothetical protein